jgi:hypothetical protein
VAATTSRSWFDEDEPATDSSAPLVQPSDFEDETVSAETRAIPVIHVEEPAQSEDGTFGDDLDIPDFLR